MKPRGPALLPLGGVPRSPEATRDGLKTLKGLVKQQLQAPGQGSAVLWILTLKNHYKAQQPRLHHHMEVYSRFIVPLIRYRSVD